MLIGLLCASLWAGARAQQVEDLSGSIEKYRSILQLAGQKLADLDLPEALARYTEVVEAFQSGQLPASAPVTRQIVGQAYEGRARTYANLGKAAEAEADFASLIKFDYAWPIDRATTSPKIVALYDKARSRLVGSLSVQSEPPGARVLLDGALVGRTPMVGFEAPVGNHTLAVEADGFAAVKESLVMTGGARVDRSLKLRPSARGLIVATVPTGVTVQVDGQARGKSFGQGAPEYADSAARLGVPLTEMSGPLLLERLAPGRHVLTFERDCFDSAQAAVEIVLDAEGANAPLRLEPIRLVSSMGTIEVKGPAKAQVIVDGKQAGVAPITVPGQCAGKRRVQVTLPGTGQWLGEVEVRSGATTSISPQMRLTLAFAGGASPPQGGSGPVEGEQEIGTALQGLAAYNVLTAQSGAPEAATGADLLVAAVPGEGAFEQKVRVTIKSTHFGFTEALDLAPGSPRWTQELTKRLDARVPLSEPWLGMELIEAERMPNPIVLAVAAGGPAAMAGVKQGETLVAIAGTATATPADATKAIASLREGAQISLSVQAPGGSPRQVNVKVTSAPVMLGRGESTLATPVLAETLLLRSRTDGAAQAQGGVERASALLSLAEILMQNNQHEAALTSALTPLQLPDGPGLSGGTVDYLKGACLLALGRKPEAAEALKRASRSQNSRLWSQDGPPVAEAAARLLETIR